MPELPEYLNPVRLSLGALRLSLHVAEAAIKLPFRIAGAVVDAARPPAGHQHEDAGTAPAEPEPVSVKITTAAPSDPVDGPRPAFPQPTRRDLRPEPPVHIDDEPELVAQFAEAGAEEGAHAELHVDEPWTGYRKMKVAEIATRLADASAAEVAVVQLYERGHRGRQTVLRAAERRAKVLANAPRS